MNTNIVTVIKMLARKQGKTMLGTFSKKYDSFKILIGTILSARCRDEVTEPVCEKLFLKYPNAKSLAAARPKDVERIIHRIGFYRQKTKYVIGSAKIIVEKHKGNVPDDFEKLLNLPGVGRKVAGCVIVYAFGLDAIPVDTHVHRLSNRLGWVKTKSPLQTEKELIRIVPKKYWQMVNDTLVAHGKSICKPVIPLCSHCDIYKYCKRVNVVKSK